MRKCLRLRRAILRSLVFAWVLSALLVYFGMVCVKENVQKVCVISHLLSEVDRVVESRNQAPAQRLNKQDKNLYVEPVADATMLLC